MSSSTQIAYDPLSASASEDPYPTYRQLRDEAPLYRCDARAMWVLSRYADVQAASRDWQTFTSARGVDPDDFGQLLGTTSFLEMDPPRHDILRKLVRHHFTPSAIRSLSEGVSASVARLTDGLAERRCCDLSAEIALRLPLLTMCHLLDLPPEHEPDLAHWTKMMMARTPGSAVLPDEVHAGTDAMKAYFDAAVTQRSSISDASILSTIAAGEQAGELVRADTLELCCFLIFAGSETASNLLSNAFFLLGKLPDHRSMLEHEASLLPAAIEEMLRYEAPVQALSRVTTCEVRLHDQAVEAGERVLLLYASANRDERQFVRPDELDFRRPRFRHLAFGEGIHFCLGAPLARLQARVALHALLNTLPRYELLEEELTRNTMTGARGFTCLPVRWVP